MNNDTATSAREELPSVCLFLSFGQSLTSWRRVGIFERELKLYKSLVDRGVAVGIVTWNSAEDVLFSDELSGIDVIPCCNVSFFSSFFAPWRLRKKIAHYDIIKTEQMFGSWIALLAAKMLRKPFLLRCGYELYRFKLQERRPFWIRLSAWILSFCAYKMSDHITLTNPDDADFVCRQFGTSLSKKISIRSNFVDTNQFYPLGLAQVRDVIAIGRLTKQKNYEALIRACSLAGCSLTVVGEGEDRHLLESLAYSLEVDANFLGRVPNEELQTVLGAHRVYVISSWFEGNPKTLLEAMASGCPIVGTDVPGIRDVLSNGVDGILCQPDRPDIIAKAIQWLLDNPNEANRLGAAARESAVAHSSLEAFVRREIDEYLAMVAQ
jgi:glycosyltransferase involved in cell wall biosynthesis